MKLLRVPSVRYCLLLLTLVSSVGCSRSGDRSEELRIGLVVSLTGAAGEQGKSWMQGAELAAEELRAAGAAVTLAVQDDGTEPARSVRSVHHLVQFENVQVLIGGTWDFLAQAIALEAQRRRIPFATPTNPVELFSEQQRSNQFLFTNATTVAATTESMACMLRSFDIKKVFSIYPDLAWGQVQAQSLRELVEDSDGIELREFPFPMESYYDSVRAAVLRSRAFAPDLIYAPIDYAGTEILLRELARLGLSPLVLGSQHLHTAIELTSEKHLYTNAFGIYPKVLDEDFAVRFERRFGQAPRVYEYAGYDLVRFFYELHRAGALSPGKRPAPPQHFSFDGLAGSYRLKPDSPQLVHTDTVLVRAQLSSVGDGMALRTLPCPA